MNVLRRRFVRLFITRDSPPKICNEHVIQDSRKSVLKADLSLRRRRVGAVARCCDTHAAERFKVLFRRFVRSRTTPPNQPIPARPRTSEPGIRLFRPFSIAAATSYRFAPFFVTSRCLQVVGNVFVPRAVGINVDSDGITVALNFDDDGAGVGVASFLPS